VEIASGALSTKRREIFDLKVSRLLEIVVVSDEVGIFLGLESARKTREDQRQRGNERNTNAVQANLLAKRL